MTDFCDDIIELFEIETFDNEPSIEGATNAVRKSE